MAFFTATPGPTAMNFVGNSSDDTVSYADFPTNRNLLLDLDSGNFWIYDNEDSIVFISQTYIWRRIREDSGTSIENAIGGSGGDRLIGTSGNNLLVGLDADQDANTGAGAAADFSPGPTLNGSGRSSPGRGHNYLDGEDGDDILIGDMGVGDGARDYLFGGNGEDILDAGIGHNDEMTGGADSDVFVFKNSTGQYRIMDFQDGWDVIQIAGEGGLDFSGLTITQVGDNAEVTFGDTKIIFQNTNTAVLDQYDFVF